MGIEIIVEGKKTYVQYGKKEYQFLIILCVQCVTEAYLISV